MRKNKADPRKPPIEDLQGQVYQHELGDPDRAAQIDRVLEEWERKASAKKRTRRKKKHLTLVPKGPLLQTHKHLLVAVDTSEVSERALAYVGELMGGRHDMRVLLLHVPRPVPPELLEFGGRENPTEEETGEAALQSDRTDWLERERLAAAPMLERAKTQLHKAGVPKEAVDTKIVPSNPNESLGSAILEVAHQKHCGTVVVGYSAFSGFQELRQKAEGLAIWVVH
jgi:nucleotide-binding universal stress UspA family protein